jgi:hypothetical protein
MDVNMDLMTKLAHGYTLWYHNPNENDWSLASYHEIITFTTIEEFWIIADHIDKHMIEYGMFFIMLDGIAPVWEDAHNINGGVLSWKVDTPASYNYWLDIAIHFIAQSILVDAADQRLITGICISPKRNFNIIKIWLNKQSDYTKFQYIPTLKIAAFKAIYKSHRNNIEKDILHKQNRHTTASTTSSSNRM